MALSFSSNYWVPLSFCSLTFGTMSTVEEAQGLFFLQGPKANSQGLVLCPNQGIGSMTMPQIWYWRYLIPPSPLFHLSITLMCNILIHAHPDSQTISHSLRLISTRSNPTQVVSADLKCFGIQTTHTRRPCTMALGTSDTHAGLTWRAQQQCSTPCRVRARWWAKGEQQELNCEQSGERMQVPGGGGGDEKSACFPVVEGGREERDGKGRGAQIQRMVTCNRLPSCHICLPAGVPFATGWIMWRVGRQQLLNQMDWRI